MLKYFSDCLIKGKDYKTAENEHALYIFIIPGLHVGAGVMASPRMSVHPSEFSFQE